MPLSVKDGMGAWVKDFQDSNAPQFKGKSDKERREMAIAAYLSAKRGDRNESVEENVSAPQTAAHRRAMMGIPKKKKDKPPFTPDPPKPAAKNSDGTKTAPMSRAKQLAKKARDAQPVDEIFAVKPSSNQILHRKSMNKMRKSPGAMTPPKKDPNSPEAQAAKRRADMMKARGRGPGFDESTNLDEAHAYSKAAYALRDYANKHGGMDKKDFHTAAKHLDNVGKAGLMQKGQHLAKMNNHFRGLDTDVRDRIHMTLKQHGVMEAVQVDELKKSTLGSYVKKAAQDAGAKAYSAAQKAMSNPDQSGKDYVKSVKRQKGIAKATDRLTKEAGTPERLAMIRKAGEKINKEKKKAERDAKRAMAKDKDLMGEAKSFDQKFRDHLKFATSKSPAVRAYLKKRAADRDAMNKELDPNAAKKGYALSAVPPERAFGKALKKGMSAAAASQAVGTASRNRNRKLPK